MEATQLNLKRDEPTVTIPFTMTVLAVIIVLFLAVKTMSMMPDSAETTTSSSYSLASNTTSCTAASAAAAESNSSLSSLSSYSSLKHDLKLVLLSSVLTCVGIMAYNYYLNVQVRRKTQEQEDSRRLALASSSALTTATRPTLANAKHKFKAASKKVSAITEIINKKASSRSIAANLAQINGITDSGNFLSALLDQLWGQMSVAIGDSIKESLDPTLRGLSVPMHFVKMDLGNVPMQTKNMCIHTVGGSGNGGAAPATGTTNMGNNIIGIAQSKSLDQLDEERGGEGGIQNGQKTGIQIDIDVCWDGNCDIMLQATLTKSAKLTFGVRHIKLYGRLHILLSPLTSALPVISAVQYGFTNPPVIEMTYTGAAGKILNVVASTLQGVITSSISSVLVLPNRLVMPMDLGRYDFLETYRPPVGMVRLTAMKGRGFTLLRGLLINDIPDIYCIIRLGGEQQFRTSTKTDNLSPTWEDESCDFIMYDMDQKVYVDVYDADVSGVDDMLGKAEVTCRDLFGEGADGEADGLCELELIMNGNKTGCYITIQGELFHLTRDCLDSFTSENYHGKNHLCGLATIIVSKATSLPLPREDAATFVKVEVRSGAAGNVPGKPKFSKEFFTGTVSDYPGIDSLNPMYDSIFYVPLTTAMLGTDKEGSDDNTGSPRRPSFGKSMSAKNIITAINPLEAAGKVASTAGKVANAVVNKVGGKTDRKGIDFIFTLEDTVSLNNEKSHGELGKLTVTYEELLSAYKHTITQTRPIGNNGAHLEFRIVFTGVQSEEEREARALLPQESIDQIIPANLPPGELVTIRVMVKRGRGFTIRKRNLRKDDVPDTYCAVRMDTSNEVWKTAVIKDDCMPNWNEERVFDNIDPARGIIHVDVYDKNSRGKDDFLGRAKFSVETLLRKREMEVELTDTTTTNSYITLSCVQLHTNKKYAPMAIAGGSELEDTVFTPKRNTDTPNEEGRDILTPLISPSILDDDEMSTGSTLSTSSTKSTSRMKRFSGGLKKKLHLSRRKDTSL